MGGWTEKVVERDGGWVGRAWWRGGGCAMSAGGRVVGWGRPWEWIGWMWERVEGCEVRSGFVAGYNGITSRLQWSMLVVLFIFLQAGNKFFGHN